MDCWACCHGTSRSCAVIIVLQPTKNQHKAVGSQKIAFLAQRKRYSAGWYWPCTASMSIQLSCLTLLSTLNTIFQCFLRVFLLYIEWYWRLSSGFWRWWAVDDHDKVVHTSWLKPRLFSSFEVLNLLNRYLSFWIKYLWGTPTSLWPLRAVLVALCRPKYPTTALTRQSVAALSWRWNNVAGFA